MGHRPGSSLKRALAGTLLSATAAVAFGAELPASARSEIEQLLAILGSSSCEFYRNGSWYTAAEAKSHLERKYDYLLKNGLLASTDDFIDKGATMSSTKGEAYQVRCPNEAPAPSAAWLRKELRRLREAPAK